MFKLSFKHLFIALGLYTALALLFFGPSLPAFFTHLIGPPEDNMFFLWNLWYGSQALHQSSAHFMHTQLVYYPEGISLFFNNYYYYGVLIATFFQSFMPLGAIYNLLILHSFILAALGAFLLAHYLTKDFWASVVAGFIFGFNPSHFAHSLHHVTIASIQWIPFFVLFYIRFLKEGQRRLFFPAVFFMLLNALCDWNFLVFDFIFIFLSWVYILAVKKDNRWLYLKRAVQVPFATAVLLSPLVLPMMLVSINSPFVTKFPGHDIYVADIAGFLVPHAYHSLSQIPWIASINKAMTGNEWESAAYLGVMNLILLASAFGKLEEGCKKYFFAFIAFAILAMGVRPHFLGRILPIILPYRLLQELPFFTEARNPARIMVYAYLFLAIIVSFSFRHFSQLLTKKPLKKWALSFFSVLLFLDFYSFASATTPVSMPKAYEVIRTDTAGDFGVLDLPWDRARYMMHQTLHGLPTVQGYIGRRLENTLIDRLIFDLKRLDEQKDMLKKNKVKYIVIHKRKMDWDESKPESRWYEVIMFKVARTYDKHYEKIYEDRDAAAYRVY